jgi:phosphatidylglycerol:prolipoprotein diacylglycerol transferase
VVPVQQPGIVASVATLAAIVPFAVIAFDFDPLLHFGDRALRLETLALAGVVLLAIVVAAVLAGRTPPEPGFDPATPPDLNGDADPDADAGRHLRRDDLLFIVLGIVPGAVLGGRLGYVLLHWDYYSVHTDAIADPAQGNLELSLAVLGGAMTGAYVARLLASSAGRWLHVATLPVLLGLGLGKLAMAAGGSGQGAPATVAWATSYLGPGPWASLAPSVPAHPAQVYEAAVTGVVLLLMVLLLAGGVFRRRDGRAFLIALLLWSAGRLVVATYWRDPLLIGPLRAGQVLALGIIGISAALFALRSLQLGRSSSAGALAEPQWADPATRPPF